MSDHGLPRGAGVPVRSLMRGLRLLELLAAGDENTVTGLAKAAELDKSTALRLLATLRFAGYVRQTPHQRYALTGHVLRLAQSYADQLDLRSVAHPHLVRLRDAVDETVHLAVIEEDQVVYIDKLDAKRSLRLASGIGHAEPIETTSLGRAILSRLPAADRDALLDRLERARRAAGVPFDRAGLLEKVDEAARRGFALDLEDNQEHVTCVGAPILGVGGRPVGAVSCSGPASRMADRIPDTGELCRQAARAISDDLGGHEGAARGALASMTPTGGV